MAYEVITLNLIPSGDVPVIHAAQYDKNRPLNFALKLGDDDFNPSGYDLELQIRKVDNNIVTVAPSAVNNNVVTFLSTEQMTACSGSNLGEIQITKDALDIATLHFYLVVQRDVLAGGMTSTSDIHNLEEQIEELLPEALGDQYYTKDQTNTLLEGKADVSDIPDMSNYYTKSETYSSGEVNTLLSAKADTSALATVATTGNYNDLTNKPSLAAVATSGLYSDLSGTPNLATVATSGSYNDLTNKPTIISYGTELPMSDTDNNKVTDVINAICELPTVKSSSGSIATFDTDLTENLVDCVVDNSATTVTRCGKNFLPMTLANIKSINTSGTWSDNSYTYNGVTYTLSVDENDNIISIQTMGTSSANSILTLANKSMVSSIFDATGENDLILNGCALGGSISTYKIQMWRTTGVLVDSGNGVTLPYNALDGATNWNIALSIENNQNVNNKTFYPMIRLATESDSTFEAYNEQTENVSDWQNITTLNGLNNVFADSGDISVKYLESIGKAISE